LPKHSFTHYGLRGIVFTLLGPGIIWLGYPVAGPLLPLANVEGSCHVLRFLSIRHHFFPRSPGFQVSLSRYVVVRIPHLLTGIVVVAIFRDLRGQTTPTPLIVLFSVSVGLPWSCSVYKQLQICSRWLKEI
jgi:hypothetical protein